MSYHIEYDQKAHDTDKFVAHYVNRVRRSWKRFRRDIKQLSRHATENLVEKRIGQSGGFAVHERCERTGQWRMVSPATFTDLEKPSLLRISVTALLIFGGLSFLIFTLIRYSRP